MLKRFRRHGWLLAALLVFLAGLAKAPIISLTDENRIQLTLDCLKKAIQKTDTLLFIKCMPSVRSEGTRKIKKAGSNLLLVTLFLYLALVIVGSCDKDISRDVAFSFHGYVTDAENQKPIVGAEILAWDRVIASTDTAGYYHYASWGGSQRLKITARAQGYLPSHKEVFIPSSSRVRVDFALSKQ